MPPVRIRPVIEGHGEVTAVPALLRRLAVAAGVEVDVVSPVRATRSRMVRMDHFEKYIAIAMSEPSDAIIVLLDADDDCPAKLGPAMQSLADRFCYDRPAPVVLAYHGFENWFLASVETLDGMRGITAPSAPYVDPEGPRYPKSRLETFMPPSRKYKETSDQAALACSMNTQLVYERCASFRKFVRCFCTCLDPELGAVLIADPLDWLPA